MSRQKISFRDSRKWETRQSFRTTNSIRRSFFYSFGAYMNIDFLDMTDSPLNNRNRALSDIDECESTCNPIDDSATIPSNSNKFLQINVSHLPVIDSSSLPFDSGRTGADPWVKFRVEQETRHGRSSICSPSQSSCVDVLHVRIRCWWPIWHGTPWQSVHGDQSEKSVRSVIRLNRCQIEGQCIDRSNKANLDE